MKPVWALAISALCFGGAAIADDGAGANHDEYFLTNVDWCKLDPVALEESDALVLDYRSVGNHAVSCSWGEALDFDALVDQTVIVTATCDNGAKSWKDDYSLSIPVVGTVAVKPVRVKRLPTVFYRCE